MRIIITENQHRLLRRVSEIEHIIGSIMDLTYEYMQGGDPSPLSMEYYDAFIDLITLKIANTIVNRSPFQEDEKEELKKEIIQFILTNHISTIRDYFSSRLDKGTNINESTHELKFKRRYEEIEDGIYDFIMTHKLNVMDTFDSFLIEISWNVASQVVSKMNISEDDYVMYRNQLIRFIKNNFYTELKEFWDRNTKRDGENINESQSKKMIQRRYEIINNYIEGNMNLSWICDYNDPLDYIVIVLDRTAEYLFDSILIPGINDVNHNLYQEVYDFISENFSDKLYDFYNENIHKCQSENFNRWR
jgi:hypothetical protein